MNIKALTTPRLNCGIVPARPCKSCAPSPLRKKSLCAPRVGTSGAALLCRGVVADVLPLERLNESKRKHLTHIVNNWYNVAFDERLPLDGLMSADCQLCDHLTRACYYGALSVKHRLLELKCQFQGCRLCHMQADADLERNTVTTHWIATVGCASDHCSVDDAVFHGVNVFTFDDDDKIVMMEAFEGDEQPDAA